VVAQSVTTSSQYQSRSVLGDAALVRREQECCRSGRRVPLLRSGAARRIAGRGSSRRSRGSSRGGRRLGRRAGSCFMTIRIAVISVSGCGRSRRRAGQPLDARQRDRPLAAEFLAPPLPARQHLGMARFGLSQAVLGTGDLVFEFVIGAADLVVDSSIRWRSVTARRVPRRGRSRPSVPFGPR